MGFYKSLRVANIITNLLNKKIGKIILFVVLCGVLFLLFSNGVLAYANDVEFTQLNGVSFDNNTGKIIENQNGKIYYVHTATDKIYTIQNIDYDGALSIRMTSTTPGVGVDFVFVTSVAVGDSYTFVGNDKYYCEIVSPESSHISYTWEYVKGSDDTVSSLVEQLTLSNTWGVIQNAIPFIGLAVLFALGFMVVRKLTKGEAKAKVKF